MVRRTRLSALITIFIVSLMSAVLVTAIDFPCLGEDGRILCGATQDIAPNISDETPDTNENLTAVNIVETLVCDDDGGTGEPICWTAGTPPVAGTCGPFAGCDPFIDMDGRTETPPGPPIPPVGPPPDADPLIRRRKGSS